jgi:hypothetical protein
MNITIFWDIAPCSPYMNRLFSETSVYVRTTRHYSPDDGNLRNYRCENLKSYDFLMSSVFCRAASLSLKLTIQLNPSKPEIQLNNI